MRLLLVPWTGTGAPFIFFFTIVLILNFTLGAGPGLLAGVLSAPIAGYLFIYQAHYTASEAIAQSILFVIETCIVSLLTVKLKKSRFKEHEALIRVENSNQLLKALAAELRKNQQLLQSIMDYSPSIIMIKDLEYRYILASRKIEQLLGVKEAEIRGKTDFELFPTEIAAGFRVNDQMVIHAGVPMTFEEAAEFHDGSHTFLSIKFPYFDKSGQILGLCGIWADITHRIQVEKALAMREAELKEAQRIAHVGSWIRDEKGNVLFWSEELYRIFGWNPKVEPPGLSELAQVYAPESMARLSPAINRLLKDGTPYQLNLEVHRPDGSTRWISTQAEAVRDSAGKIVGFREVAHDITELKQLQTMREEWTSVIAHDLRQPIGVILMSVDLLLTFHSGEIEEKEKRIYQRIKAAATNLSRMVNDLLNISQMESRHLRLQRSWLNPRVLITEIVERLSHMTSGFSVTIAEKGDLAPVFADPTRVEQILGNLISNAAKYGKGGSEIQINLIQQEDQMQISVTNQGRGIPPEEIGYLFHRFSRAISTRQSGIPGLGLGLYITKGLVEAHGGKIWVESMPGKTTTFSFTLPTRITLERTAA